MLLVLRLDGRRKSTVSYALWIPVIWMLYSSSRPVSFWLGGALPTTAEEFMEGNPLDRNILSVLTILGIYVLLRRRIKWKTILKNNAFFVLWFSYCGISILWSDFPIVSLKRWIKEIGLLISVLIVLTEKESVEAVKAVIKRFSYLLVSLSIMLIMFFPQLGMTLSPDTGLTGSYAGISYNKNGLGRICLVAGFYLFCNWIAMRKETTPGKNKEKTLISFLFLILTVWLLIITDSATSSSSFLIGIIISGWVEVSLKIIWNISAQF